MKATIPVKQAFGAAILVTVLASAGFCQETEPTAQSIIQQMVHRYSTVTSYRDSGTVETSHLRKHGTDVQKVHFKMWFVRPQFFRFEWETESDYLPKPPYHIVWCDGKRSFTYFESNAFWVEEDLSAGIARSSGASSMAVRTVASYLIDEMTGAPVTESLKGIALKATESLEGADCFVLTGLSPTGRRYELWIGRQDHLLHRVRSSFESSTSIAVVNDEIHRDIQLNQTIPAELFQFRPPMLPPKDPTKARIQPKPGPATLELTRRGIAYSPEGFVDSAEQGDTSILALFLDAGMDPNTKDEYGRAALVAAAEKGSEGAVNLLLAKGASVNLTDYHGITALHAAAEGLGSLKCFKALLAHGADVHAKTPEGKTPLVAAIPVLPPLESIQAMFLPEAIEKITALLDHGADINVRFVAGITPLMRAAVNGNIGVIELLLKRGADPKATDNRGQTARQIALQYDHEDAAKIIERAGG